MIRGVIAGVKAVKSKDKGLRCLSKSRRSRCGFAALQGGKALPYRSAEDANAATPRLLTQISVRLIINGTSGIAAEAEVQHR